MKIFAFSGLGVDERVFEKLEINEEIVHLPWLGFSPEMSLKKYAKLYLPLLPDEEKFGILGLSFGGLMAIELSKISKPEFTILISSVERHWELPSLYRWIGKLRFHKVFPASFFIPPMFLANYLFRPKNKILLHEILSDSDPNFNKWAVDKLLNWQGESKLKKILRIHGANDKLIPLPKDPKIIILQNSSHFMIHNEADEISGIINQFLLDTKAPRF